MNETVSPCYLTDGPVGLRLVLSTQDQSLTVSPFSSVRAQIDGKTKQVKEQ